jgi:hypothetical protein
MPYDERADHLLAYFTPDVLAAYMAQSDKYTVQTDYFEGEVATMGAYFERLEAESRTDESISVRFGYRTTADGELAVVIWAPDLVEKSPFHLDRWKTFAIDKESTAWLAYDQDTRFSLWVRRYLEGDWEVDDGPGAALGERIALVNGLTLEAVGLRLFDVDDVRVMFPGAENSHRYADAHRELYGILVDSLDKPTIEALAELGGQPVKCASEKTLHCLRKVFPALTDVAFSSPLAQVSDQRRLATHKVRPAAESMKAFEAFTTDLHRCVAAMDVLLAVLEDKLDLDAGRSRARQDALRHLRPIEDSHLPGNYSIHGAVAMVGKTVERVEIGEGKRYPNSHGSEAIRIHFNDGSIVALDTGSNAWNLSQDFGGALGPQDFHVDFHVQWVPPRKRRSDPEC